MTLFLRCCIDTVMTFAALFLWGHMRGWLIDWKERRAIGRCPMNVFGDQVFPDFDDPRWKCAHDYTHGAFIHMAGLSVFDCMIKMNGVAIVFDRKCERLRKAVFQHRADQAKIAARAEAEKLLTP